MIRWTLKNLQDLAQEILSMVDHFWTLYIKGLKPVSHHVESNQLLCFTN